MAKINRYNAEGYHDPTTHDALLNIAQEAEDAERRTNALIKILKGIIDLAGFDLVARIEVRDRATGKIFR